MRKIILASASPRRQRTAGGGRCYFSGMCSRTAKKRLQQIDPEEIVCELSAQKADGDRFEV